MKLVSIVEGQPVRSPNLPLPNLQGLQTGSVRRQRVRQERCIHFEAWQTLFVIE